VKILVTGGAGFIGSHLCEKLLVLHHQVYCLDNFCDFYNPKIKENNISELYLVFSNLNVSFGLTLIIPCIRYLL
jgi:UDP-glucuronate 4-epimerase